MRSFNIPFRFQSPHITRIKQIRAEADKKKKDLAPTALQFDTTTFYLPRYFGFCFGVQNAVEKAYEVIDKHPGKKIYLISEIVHNPEVNNDLKQKGLRFILDTKGNELISWDEISDGDIVIIPAFGTTIAIENLLQSKGITVETIDTTCPFVERVWKKGEVLGKAGFTVIIHGDPYHEETRATLSRISQYAPAVVVADMRDAQNLGEFILNKGTDEGWNTWFKWKSSDEFNFRIQLNRIAVVNQTTMLAPETQKISNYLKEVIRKKNKREPIDQLFGSTRDTLCYATNDNQLATEALLHIKPDIVFVVGGSNSSNTTHLVEMLKDHQATYFIETAADLESAETVRHFNIQKRQFDLTTGYLPQKERVKIGISSGASCPDETVEQVLMKLLSFTNNTISIDAVINQLEEDYNGL